jgi:hypothetical protein
MAGPSQTASAAANAFVADIRDRYEQSEEEREARRQAFEPRTKVIASAINLIVPAEQDRQACCAAIWDGLDGMAARAGRESEGNRRKTKSSKKAAGRVVSRLRAARAASNGLDFGARLAFPHEAVAKAIEFYEVLEREPARLNAKSEPEKTRAAELADRLLLRFSSERPTLTKDGPFCRLAALLSGEPDADRSYICRKVIGRR